MSLRVKEILIVICLMSFIVFISRQNNYVDIDASDILDNIVEVVDIGDMEEFTNSDIKKDFGVNANDYASIVYYGHQSVMNSETVLIVKLADESQAQDIMDIIDTQKESNMQMFKSYAPEQYKLLSESILEQKGSYILYVVSENAGDIERAFTDIITG